MAEKKDVKLDEQCNLKCPHCSEAADMHHDNVRVLDRGEDAAGQKFEFSPTGFVRVTHLEANSPEWNGRRHSLEVDFKCWMCKRDSTLKLVQHKGVTYLQWKGEKTNA